MTKTDAATYRLSKLTPSINPGAPSWLLTINGRKTAILNRTRNGWRAKTIQGHMIASLCGTQQECLRQVLNHPAQATFAA